MTEIAGNRLANIYWFPVLLPCFIWSCHLTGFFFDFLPLVHKAKPFHAFVLIYFFETTDSKG